MSHDTSCSPRTTAALVRSRFEIADIFRAHGEAYRRSHVLDYQQARVMRDIMRCRTAELGGHLDVCAACGDRQPSYNSCRNRHCPKCQGLRQLLWLEGRKARILPTHYFHVVFTLPSELRAVALRNRALVFGLLFAAASKTLLAFGSDPKRLGAQLGITAVLHTWTRQLHFHPHVHCIVTGGGLSRDGERWVATRPDFLFPVRALGKVFRGKMREGLARAHELGELRLGEGEVFDNLDEKLRVKNWVVYCKRPFGGPEHVYRYLGRYTHRIAITNHRLVSVTDDDVVFKTKNGDFAVCSPTTFISRFLQHVLPPRFVKIRHYGLMAGANAKTRLERARQLLEPDANHPADLIVVLDWIELLARDFEIDIAVCLRCHQRARYRTSLPRERAPPARGAAA